MKKITGLCTLCAVCLTLGLMTNEVGAANFSYTSPNNTYNSQTAGSLQGKVTYVPKGAIATVML